jgi:hypothetical protein
MARVDDLLSQALSGMPLKPADNGQQKDKKRYSELISQEIALVIAEELRLRGLSGTRPERGGGTGGSGNAGAERRLAGGIGAKKVDVSWATEESGLLLGVSIKTINFRDSKTGNFQKNLTNRRGDMLFEAVTLHRRFPYAVLGGLFILDREAAQDGTDRRRSTFLNAHNRFRLFTGRNDPAGRDEQYERLYLMLLDSALLAKTNKGSTVSERANPKTEETRSQEPSFQEIWPWQVFEVGSSENPVPLTSAIETLVRLTAERNPDFYECVDGVIVSAGG